MWIHRTVDLGITHAQEKDETPTRVQSLGTFGLLLCSNVTEVDEERCPISLGSDAPVPPEAKAFEAPHEKCQNTQ